MLGVLSDRFKACWESLVMDSRHAGNLVYYTLVMDSRHAGSLVCYLSDGFKACWESGLLP